MSDETLTQKNESPERFESDSQKIVRRHLEDENHIITDEEIRGVRIGAEPVVPDNTEQKFEELVDDLEKENEDPDKKEVDPSDNPVTPWDTIQR